jgi:hypothetical protein
MSSFSLSSNKHGKGRLTLKRSVPPKTTGKHLLRQVVKSVKNASHFARDLSTIAQIAFFDKRLVQCHSQE